jgi:hypothetical protein
LLYFQFAPEDFVKLIHQAITTRISNMIQSFVFHPPRSENDCYSKNSIVNAICSFLVICSSPLIQQCTTDDVKNRFLNDLYQILSNYNFRRNAYLKSLRMSSRDDNSWYCERMLRFLATSITLGTE